VKYSVFDGWLEILVAGNFRDWHAAVGDGQIKTKISSSKNCTKT